MPAKSLSLSHVYQSHSKWEKIQTTSLFLGALRIGPKNPQITTIIAQPHEYHPPQERLKSFHLDGKRVLLCTDEVLSSYAKLIPEAVFFVMLEWGKRLNKNGAKLRNAQKRVRLWFTICELEMFVVFSECFVFFWFRSFISVGVVRFLISIYVGRIDRIDQDKALSWCRGRVCNIMFPPKVYLSLILRQAVVTWNSTISIHKDEI